jgi:glycosyltransferase involved in cell wall biosynthesis
VSIFFIRPTYSKKGSSPTKQGEIMSMGIPVICNSGIGDTDEIIRQTSSGIIVSDFSTAAYDKVIEQLPEVTQLSPDKIRQSAIDFFSLDKGVERYHDVYQQLR